MSHAVNEESRTMKMKLFGRKTFYNALSAIKTKFEHEDIYRDNTGDSD
jgi:hypothetical protein